MCFQSASKVLAKCYHSVSKVLPKCYQPPRSIDILAVVMAYPQAPIEMDIYMELP